MVYKKIEFKNVNKLRKVFESFGYIENIDYFVMRETTHTRLLFLKV